MLYTFIYGFVATPVSRVPPRSINICCVLVYHIIYDIHISFTIYFQHNIHVIYIYIWFCGFSCVMRPPNKHNAGITYHTTYLIFHGIFLFGIWKWNLFVSIHIFPTCILFGWSSPTLSLHKKIKTQFSTFLVGVFFRWICQHFSFFLGTNTI